MGMVGLEVVEYLGINKNRGEIHVDYRWNDVFAISGVVNLGEKHPDQTKDRIDAYSGILRKKTECMWISKLFGRG
jgi:hypothetical protein